MRWIKKKIQIEYIKKRIKNIDDILQDQKSFEINFKNISDKYFFDIENHRKASIKPNSWSLYCALGYAGFRKLRLSNSNFISLIAYIFSILVRIYHIPRLLKQKLFPGLGKQNYT